MSVIGGPTTVIDCGGWRFVIDPTFDEPGPAGHLTKTAGPAVRPEDLGNVDVVLISHDEHLDNLDEAGRRFALSGPQIVTHPDAARRLGGRSVGLEPWQSFALPAKPQEAQPVTVWSVPAVHGPADGERDASGHITCRVTGFVLTGDDVPRPTSAATTRPCEWSQTSRHALVQLMWLSCSWAARACRLDSGGGL